MSMTTSSTTKDWIFRVKILSLSTKSHHELATFEPFAQFHRVMCDWHTLMQLQTELVSTCEITLATSRCISSFSFHHLKALSIGL